MLSQAIMLTALLGAAPPESPANVTAPADGQVCVTAPPAPERIDAQPFQSTAADGTRSWGATATYRLSTGDLGEAFMVLDDDGSGEAQLMIDGEIIAHAAVTVDSDGQLIVTTWQPSSMSHSPAALAEMMQVDLPGIVAGSLPQEFKCSDWGRKVMKAGKYMAVGLIGAGMAACCIASQGLACIACGGATAVGTLGVIEFADGYCD